MYATFNDLLRAKVPEIVDRSLSLLGVAAHDVRKTCSEETTQLVDFLLAATMMRRPSLFVEYVAWVESVMRARGASLMVLRAAIAEIREAAERVGGPDAAVAMEIADEALACVGSVERAPEVSAPLQPSVTAALSNTYLELLLAGNRREAAALVHRSVDGGLSLEDLYLQVLQPAMREVGRLWQANRISVAQEHYVSAATQLIVSQLYPRLLDGPRNGKMMIAGSVESNLHEIGLRFLCDIFELRGWDTHFYGANTPTRDLIDTIRKRKPNIVAIGATLASQLPPLVNFIQMIRQDPEAKKIPILVGGAAFWGNEDLWKEIGADGFAFDAVSATRLAHELTGDS